MMEQLTPVRSLFEDTKRFAGQTVKVGGWVRNLRASKNFGFINLSDGTYFSQVQVVFGAELANFQEISKLNISAAVIVTGTLVVTPDAKQPFEIQASEISVEGPSTPDFPIQPKRHSMEFLRTLPHLRVRTNTFQAVFRVRSIIAYAIHKFFQERSFVYVHTPLITGSDCEGAGEMFQVTTLDLNNPPRLEDGSIDYSEDFFGKETNLTVSGQLNGEAFAQAFRNIYTFGPTFRAENSNTTRHAAEFWMIEPEMAFADLSDDMRVAEDMIKFVISYVLENAPEEMAFFNQFVDKGLLDRLNHVMTSEFGHVTYTEAVKLLEQHNDKFDYKVFWGCDLQTEHERYLTEQIFKRPVFVTDYPKEIKAFYMKLNEDGKTVAAMDCLVPGIGEIIGGSQREDNYDTLLARMNELGLKPEDYGFYLDLRKYGSTRHAGRPWLRALRHVPHGYLQHPRRAPVPENRRQLRALIEYRTPRQEDGTSSCLFSLSSNPCVGDAPEDFGNFVMHAPEGAQKSGRGGHASRVEGRGIGGFSAKVHVSRTNVVHMQSRAHFAQVIYELFSL